MQNRWRIILLGIGSLFLVAVLGTVVVFPILFRGLSESDQHRIVRRLPFLEFLLPPTLDVEGILPTVNAPTIDPAALLRTLAVPSPTFTLAASATLPASATPTPTTPPTHTPSPTPSAIPPTLPAATTPASAATTPPITPVATVAVLPTETPTDRPTEPPSMTPPPTETPTLTYTPSVTPTLGMLVVLATYTPAESGMLPTATPTPPGIITATPFPTFPATNTPAASATPTLTPLSPTLLPTNTPFPVPASHRLAGRLSHEPQLWNNCGPANLVQAMRYYGWREGQYEVASFLKPNTNDKNVSLWEMERYVNSRTNLRAKHRAAGNLDLLREFVARDLAVIVETGFYDPDEPEKGWIGHYLTISGYDNRINLIWTMDTLRQETSENFARMDELWSHFNRQYLVIYPLEREAEVADILGPDADPAYNAQNALNIASAAAEQNPSSPFAWFNIGTSLTVLGRYAEAAQAYDVAYTVQGMEGIPYRMMWYQFEPFIAYYNARRFDFALALINATITTSKDNVEEMFYYRGLINASLGDTANALADLQTAAALNPNFSPALAAFNQIQSGTFQPPAGG
ncbi:MAG TPA: tetratricopeptide repeat protein [Aggregatilineales bacterium]|nr:tetratricopeptide repeat protein [Anaerolineales bacterium]HRE46306.1 tetratricopeptide repeat protein [Aggregatilineales bacterium]